MSTRYSKSTIPGVDAIDLGYSGSSQVDVPEVPSCSIEDVDRALFNLFNRDIPLVYESKGSSTKRVPVIFATGERFAIIRKKEPLRDKNGALILPLITVFRSGIEQSAEKIIQPGDIGTIEIQRKISKEDPVYQRVVNSLNLSNTGSPTSPTRRGRSSSPTRTTGGRLLEPNLSVPLYETIVVPTPKFFTATYEVTLWTQFMQHGNSLLNVIMSGYHDVRGMTYRIETEKGYWFVARFESGIQSDNNFDNMSDEERIIKHTFTVKVPAFILAPREPGIPIGVRRVVSATQFSFGIISGDVPDHELQGNTPDMRLGSRVLDQVSTVDDPSIVSSIGSGPARQAELAAGGNQKFGTSSRKKSKESVGGSDASSMRTRSITQRISVDPMTGEPVDAVVRKKTISSVHGESVLTTINTIPKSNKDDKP
jgi:hypothetical protein